MKKINLKEQINSFFKDPYSFLDNMNLKYRGFDFNFYSHDDRVRKGILYICIFFTAVWLIMGFDSGAGQIEFPLMYIWEQLTTGQPIDFNQISYLYHWAYGKYMHWSVFPIYGLSFWYLSRYYANKLNIRGSQNFGYTFSFSIMSVGIFEWFWMISFYVFQGQPWILWWQPHQLRLLVQNLALTIIGVWAFFTVRFETPFRIRLDKWVFILLIITISTVFLWWFYPLPVTPVHVQTTTGVWSNSRLFPQTVYTVDIDPLDNIAIGEQHYIEDNMIHLVNTVCKVAFAMLVLGLSMLTVNKKYADSPDPYEEYKYRERRKTT